MLSERTQIRTAIYYTIPFMKCPDEANSQGEISVSCSTMKSDYRWKLGIFGGDG